MSTPPPGYPGFRPPPDHPQTTTVLVLGILGLAFCGVLAPFAWLKGRTVLAEIDASQGRTGGRSQVYAGYIMGIIGTAMLALSLLVGLGGLVVFLIVGAAESSA
ncbi:DUF4190 domain-containing protein [Nocardia asteroides]|uniref:DUF4190 domain-containing protein n=1 Tax=Nocardia asteroides NBRC 15531 TaxID=1110697 RepID=U5E387_NOCAS|nr:DUF4190 domain-containing protein [Nocardia asteroides]TLF69382.1 DUF4190 domain-containing protein [Nocardia asteroides NBRC 15531]UGT48876.1 DUF4190 domain-containing protein [Nocardia asteroides]SFL73564.1 hypothetical protein SAMN05444423_101717 [Nocardia asteroides]VEG31357.1 Uncharacterised protein [Nocardia asteroides]GAD82102.1 hypothetical protein NCAST_06_00190 [Nocardia asteroides NBRC 15531]